jgi:phage-related protein
MATFPKLKTGAVAQYPATRSVRFQNQTLRFLDGQAQRYRDAGKGLLLWEIRLDQLDEGEQAAVEDFFSQNHGAFGSFAFTDPHDGHVYDNCSLESDGLEVAALSEMHSSTIVTVVENAR